MKTRTIHGMVNKSDDKSLIVPNGGYTYNAKGMVISKRAHIKGLSKKERRRLRLEQKAKTEKQESVEPIQPKDG